MSGLPKGLVTRAIEEAYTLSDSEAFNAHNECICPGNLFAVSLFQVRKSPCRPRFIVFFPSGKGGGVLREGELLVCSVNLPSRLRTLTCQTKRHKKASERRS